jgi:hypothetical protein
MPIDAKVAVAQIIRKNDDEVVGRGCRILAGYTASHEQEQGQVYESDILVWSKWKHWVVCIEVI